VDSFSGGRRARTRIKPQLKNRKEKCAAEQNAEFVGNQLGRAVATMLNKPCKGWLNLNVAHALRTPILLIPGQLIPVEVSSLAYSVVIKNL
jgi:hypothetical protein